MKIARLMVAAVSILMLLVPSLFAQEKTNSDNAGPTAILKVQVTVAEQEGEKKVASLPYTLFLLVGEVKGNTPWTKVRMGSRVPAYVGKDGGMQYLDVGANIDARGYAIADGRFEISLNLERSWVEGEAPGGTEKAGASESNPAHSREPVIRQFKTETTLVMRDGQTIQSVQAPDPLSGRLFVMTVTMNVVK